MQRPLALPILALVAALGLGAHRADADSLTQVTSFGANPGALDMYTYVPANLPAGRPLVVVMHGCTQTAASMQAAGWDALADQYEFAVLYPQERAANQPLSCFRWYEPAQTARGGGEAASIIAMVDTMISANRLATARVYVTGLSSGAAFTAVMLATYPERFAAGSIMSGIPYGCATDLTSAASCEMMKTSTQRSAAAWGALVTAASSGFTGAWPRVQIWQGSADTTVFPANAGELVKEWTDVHAAPGTPSATDAISGSTRTQYSAGGQVVVEAYVVSGMGHDVATGMDALGACPAGTGAYFADEHICSTLRAAQFFGLLDGGGGSGSGSGSGSGGNGSGSGSSGSGSGGSGSDGEQAGGNTSSGCSAGDNRGGWLVALVAVAALRRRRPLTP